jgi:hypothetical protein
MLMMGKPHRKYTTFREDIYEKTDHALSSTDDGKEKRDNNIILLIYSITGVYSIISLF